MLDIIKPRLGVCHTLRELMRPSVGTNKHSSVKRCYFTCRWRHKCRHQLLYLQSGVEQKCETKTASVFLITVSRIPVSASSKSNSLSVLPDAVFCTHIWHVEKKKKNIEAAAVAAAAAQISWQQSQCTETQRSCSTYCILKRFSWLHVSAVWLLLLQSPSLSVHVIYSRAPAGFCARQRNSGTCWESQNRWEKVPGLDTRTQRESIQRPQYCLGNM